MGENMYLVITQYGHETGFEEFKTKKQVKEHIEEYKSVATWVGIYKVSKELSVEDFQD